MTIREMNEAITTILQKSSPWDISLSTYRAHGLRYITHDEGMCLNLVSFQTVMGRAVKPDDKRLALATFRKILSHQDWALVFERPVLDMLNSFNWQDDSNIERLPSASEVLRK